MNNLPPSQDEKYLQLVFPSSCTNVALVREETIHKCRLPVAIMIVLLLLRYASPCMQLCDALVEFSRSTHTLRAEVFWIQVGPFMSIAAKKGFIAVSQSNAHAVLVREERSMSASRLCCRGFPILSKWWAAANAISRAVKISTGSKISEYVFFIGEQPMTQSSFDLGKCLLSSVRHVQHFFLSVHLLFAYVTFNSARGRLRAAGSFVAS